MTILDKPADVRGTAIRLWSIPYVCDLAKQLWKESSHIRRMV